MKSKIYLLASLLFFLFGCDTIEGVYIEDPSQLNSTVTLFEFTGIECVNCPEKGHEVVAAYQKTFGDKLQVVSIHGDEFGSPINGFFLRTSEGEKLASLVEVSVLPKGTLNALGTDIAKVPSALSADISKYGYKLPDLDLNVDFEISGNTATVSIKGEFSAPLKQTYEKLNIAVYLLQSYIEGPQKDLRVSGGEIEDYIHMHALRKPFTAITGDFLVSNPNAGMVIEEIQYTMDLTKANLIFADGETVADLHIEPLVFVLNADSKRELIPCLINYN